MIRRALPLLLLPLLAGCSRLHQITLTNDTTAAITATIFWGEGENASQESYSVAPGASQTQAVWYRIPKTFTVIVRSAGSDDRREFEATHYRDALGRKGAWRTDVPLTYIEGEIAFL